MDYQYKELLDNLLEEGFYIDSDGILKWAWLEEYSLPAHLNNKLVKYYRDNNLELTR